MGVPPVCDKVKAVVEPLPENTSWNVWDATGSWVNVLFDPLMVLPDRVSTVDRPTKVSDWFGIVQVREWSDWTIWSASMILVDVPYADEDMMVKIASISRKAYLRDTSVQFVPSHNRAIELSSPPTQEPLRDSPLPSAIVTVLVALRPIKIKRCPTTEPAAIWGLAETVTAPAFPCMNQRLASFEPVNAIPVPATIEDGDARDPVTVIEPDGTVAQEAVVPLVVKNLPELVVCDGAKASNPAWAVD